MRKTADQIFEVDQVILVPLKKDKATLRPALITRIGDDTGKGNTIHYSFISPEGTLSGGGDYMEPWNTDGVKHIDFAKVRTVVDLPPEYAERAVEYDKTVLKQQAKYKEVVNEWEPESHPSYAVVEVSRVSGSQSLFMSPFDHQHSLRLRIRRAEKSRSLSNDHSFGGGQELIEIGMSEAQWARMLSSAGIGSGVPCTLMRLGGQLVPDCPSQPDVERFHEDIKRNALKANEKLKEALDAATALLADKAPTKEKRAHVQDLISTAYRANTDAIPFVAEQLRERMEHIVAEGKTEIEAFTQQTLIATGLEKFLPSGGAEKSPITLNLEAGNLKKE